MSNLFLLRRKRKQNTIRRNTVRLVIRLLIALLLISGLVYIVIEYVLKPNLTVKSVEISFTVDELPVSDPLSEIAASLEGISFSSAEPVALEQAFEGFEEIIAADVSRSWGGSLSIQLTPRIPLCFMALPENGGGYQYVPVDMQGAVYTVSGSFQNFFLNGTGRTDVSPGRIPVIFIEQRNRIYLQEGKIPDDLLETALLLDALRAHNRDSYNLITRVKYDNNSKHSYTAVYLNISGRNIELQLSEGLKLDPLHSYIQAIIGNPDIWQKPDMVVSVYNDSAVCRL